MRPWLIVLLLVAGCGSETEEERLRAAAERYREASAERDFATVWDLLDKGSRETYRQQLLSFLNLKPSDVAYRTVWKLIREQYGLEREAVESMDARAWFIALYEGSDRVKPELKASQGEEARDSKVEEVRMEGTRGESRIVLPSGRERIDYWSLEAGAWKVTAAFGSATREGS